MGRKLLWLLLTVSLLAALSAGFVVYRWLHTPLNIEQATLMYQVDEGSSLIRVANDLARQGVLRFPELLPLYARVREQTNIKIGEYRIQAGTTPAQLLDKLYRGEVITYTATIIEGWTFQQTLSYLQAQPKLEIVLSEPEARDNFIASLELPGDHPEGWFFPDTYQYVAGASDKKILTQAHKRMRDVLATEWANRVGSLPYDSPYEALIMASIVERETGVPSERGQIAGVFVRRLERNMRLQTDPTVIYGLGDDYTGNIRRRHLDQVTPYNTYRIPGLPPTPIAMPGREAIHATLHPAEGEALYFVAKGDGSHHFSATLEEHNRAVRRYQVEQRARDYQSAPQPESRTQESDSQTQEPESQTQTESP